MEIILPLVFMIVMLKSTLLKKEGVHIEKEIQNMAIRHDQRIKDILRYYPDNDYF